MKIINALIGYFMFWFSPKSLMRKSLNGALLQLGVRLPSVAIDAISAHLFDIYDKNRRINKTMNKGGMTENMETMWALIENEAYYIRDIINPSYVYINNNYGHEKTIEIFKKYNILIQQSNEALRYLQ